MNPDKEKEHNIMRYHTLPYPSLPYSTLPDPHIHIGNPEYQTYIKSKRKFLNQRFESI